MCSFELTYQCGIFKCMYVENISDMFILSHFVFSSNCFYTFTFLRCGWEVLLCFMHFFCERIHSDQSRHLLSGTQEELKFPCGKNRERCSHVSDL